MFVVFDHCFPNPLNSRTKQCLQVYRMFIGSVNCIQELPDRKWSPCFGIRIHYRIIRPDVKGQVKH